MKYRGTIFFSAIAILILVAAYYPKVDNAQKEAALMHTILGISSRYHYEPKQIDDKFSEQAYEGYLEQIDYMKRFLTQEDIDQLKPYRKQLDDQALAGTFEFFNLSLGLLEKGLDKTQGYYRELLANPFDYSLDETVELDGDKKPYAKDDAALKDFWRKFLKNQVLSRLITNLNEQEKEGEEGEKKSFEELEQEARTEVLGIYDRFYERLDELEREDRLSQYLNSFTTIFDPHTNFFKPFDKQQFDIRFSGKLEGIGARLQTDGEHTKVSSIVVGGPAWKQKELKEDDIILKVAQGDEEPVDITGKKLDDVVQLVRGDKGTEVRLTVKKEDGSVKVIPIIREVVIIDEQFAKSLILDGAKDGEKIGYISLPGFYADFSNRGGRFSSEDVAVEIEKLKAENVDGIILDLRFNGGGSLREVEKMTGFFIEKGPVVQVKARGRKPEVSYDSDPRVQYDGPLVVMVNSFSASASEILAAALQDYGRAVIVGSKSTHGKGTVQRFFDLDRLIEGNSDIKPLGQIKLTIQNYYRINGGSVQLKGVTPDVILPDNYHYLKTGEKEEENALAWSEIPSTNYGQSVVNLNNMEFVRANSAERVERSPIFKKVLENAKRLKKQRDQTSYPLNLEDYKAFQKDVEEEAAKYSEIFKEVVNAGISNLPTDLPTFDMDESKKARNEDWIKTVSKDIYIKETLNVMHDLIKSSK